MYYIYIYVLYIYICIIYQSNKPTTILLAKSSRQFSGWDLVPGVFFDGPKDAQATSVFFTVLCDANPIVNGHL